MFIFSQGILFNYYTKYPSTVIDWLFFRLSFQTEFQSFLKKNHFQLLTLKQTVKTFNETTLESMNTRLNEYKESTFCLFVRIENIYRFRYGEI